MIAFLTLTGSQAIAVGFLDIVEEFDTSVTTLSVGVTLSLLLASLFCKDRNCLLFNEKNTRVCHVQFVSFVLF